VSNNHEIYNLYPYMSKKDLMNMYRSADIFIMPSYNETFGLVYLEAMSQGLPIIYTINDGVDGYFRKGEVGYSVNPDNIDDIAKKVELIINNYDDISNKAVELSKRFSWDIISDKYIEIYSKLTSS
ncbi:MAG: glycosyltransferase, partial [bacterium]